MLPAESLADAVSFFGYYDLGGLKLTNKLFSSVANRCADAIRLFDFSGFSFNVYDSSVHVYQLESGHRPWVCFLTFASEKELAVFVSEAFRNCTAGGIVLAARQQSVHSAFKFVAKTIVVADTLTLFGDVFKNEQKGLEFVDRFRRVETLKIRLARDITLARKKIIETFCRRKDIVLDIYDYPRLV